MKQPSTHNRDQRALVMCALFFFIVLAVVTATGSASAETLPGVTNLDVVLILDQSGSMAYNDPPVLAPDGSVRSPGWRFVSASLLADWLGIDHTGGRHQMSVVMFGTDAKVIFPLQEIHSVNARATLKKVLAENNRSYGTTDILKALRVARAELDKGRSDANVKRVVIFLSDGQCQPTEPPNISETIDCNRQVRALVHREFADGTRPIFTIALTSDATKGGPDNTIYKNLWQEIATTTGGDYYEPVKAGQELMDAMVQIQQRLFGLPAQRPSPPVDAPKSVSFDVPANLAQVSFSVIKFDPAITVTLTRPDHKLATSNDTGIDYSRSDFTESYNALKPDAGQWTVDLTGRGQASVVMVPFINAVTVVDRLTPLAAHPQGKPMSIRVRVLDGNQKPTQLPDLTVALRQPDDVESRVRLQPDGTAYTGLFSNTGQIGTYQLGFSTLQGSQQLASQQVRVVAAPWIMLSGQDRDRFTQGNQPAIVRALVMSNKLPIGELKQGERLEVLMRLANASGQVVDSQVARAEPGGVFTATLTHTGNGRYSAQAQLSYVSPAGETFSDVAEMPFVVNGVAEFVPAATATAQPAPVPVKQVDWQILGVTLPTWAPLVAVAAVAAAVLATVAGMLSALGGIRRSYRQSLAQQDVMLRGRRVQETLNTMQSDQGWQTVASQLVADALNEPTAIDGDAGFLDVVSHPYLKFTVLTRDGIGYDGREVVFTTNPGLMKKLKLIRRGDRIMDITRRSASAHADAGLLWRAALAQRNQENVVPPSAAHWYVVAAAKPRHSSKRGLPGSG